MALHGVSQITVKQAITGLVQDGLVIRRPGVGSFVTKPKVEQQLLNLTSFSEDMARRGLRPGAKVLQTEITGASAYEAEQLEIPPGEALIRITRLRLADDEPMAIEAFAIPQMLCPGLISEELENVSLYRLLAEKYGINIDRAYQQLEPIRASKSEAKLLHIPAGTPLLQTERCSLTNSSRKVEYTKSVYRGDRYKFWVSISR